MSDPEVITGGDIIGHLLLADEPVTELIAAASIKAGRLPSNVMLPALLVRVVSSTDRMRLKRGSTVRCTDRVSVTVRAASHRERKLAIYLVGRACADRVGNIAGAQRVSVLTAGKGPETDGPADTFEQAQDFRVSFDVLA